MNTETEPRARSRSSDRISIPHLPAIDGLRGLAVLGVLLFHDDRLTGGYLGVDLFFVLSGYLITSLLLAEWAASGTISLRNFWIRRARRLFPALLALLPAVGLYAAIFAEPRQLTRIRYDSLATLAYVANWRTIFSGESYWDLFAAPSPLNHTWSLAIEEQFYVVWPLLVFGLLTKFRGRVRALLVTSALLCVASVTAMAVLYSPDNVSRAYEGTDTRGAGILAGACVACVLRLVGPLQDVRWIRRLDIAGIAVTLGLGLAWTLLDWKSPFLYRGGMWLTEVAVVVLIVCAAHGKPSDAIGHRESRPSSLVARALAFRPLVFVGLISYGLYLWHWPIFVLLTKDRTGLSSAPVSLLRFAVTFAIALISYRYLEQPIRKRGLSPTFGRPILVIPTAVAAAVAAVILSTQGASRAAKPETVRSLPSARLPENATKILVLGDSVAESLGERLQFMQKDTGAFVLERGIGDCSILHDQLPTKSLNNRPHDGGDCDAHWATDVAELSPDVTLVVLGGGFFAPVQVYGKWQRACEEGWHRAYAMELRRGLESIEEHGGRLFLALVPYPSGPFTGHTPREWVDCFNETLREVAAGLPKVTLLDLGSKLCPGGNCVERSRGALIRPDGLHFQGLGAEDIATWILDRLRAPTSKYSPT